MDRASDAIVKITGSSEQGSAYVVTDTQMAAGSTLGSPRAVVVIKATGALEKFYSVEAGRTVIGTVMVHHWDEVTGVPLTELHGHFVVHPEHQEHVFTLSNGVTVHEDVFVLSGRPEADRVDPPAAYIAVRLTNGGTRSVRIGSYASAALRGELGNDVRTTYSRKRHAFAAWNTSQPGLVRMFGVSARPTSFESTNDRGKPSAAEFPGRLSDTTLSESADPIGILHFSRRLDPGASTSFTLRLSFSTSGRAAASRTYQACPPAAAALARTQAYYREVLGRAVVITPDPDVNRGVLWAKANMLRTQLLAQTGWAVVNDPTRSNNSVARDTAWFAYGSDYITPEFSRRSLLWYAHHLEKDGMVVEYYDIRTGHTADYALNINDDTPLLVLALWHHYRTTADRAFLEEVYPRARSAARYILSQRNDQGLVWCTATGTSDWGIVGWRNVIADYTLSGATTELNSECYAALQAISNMARELGQHDEAATFRDAADELRASINAHLLNPETGLYYLNIDPTGVARTDVTADLVFPVMFGVADDDTAAGIISRLSRVEFWTDYGIRTVPRDAIDYGPVHGYGLLGGVWVAQAFWFAFAAARFNPRFMAAALSNSFRYYSIDPLRNNTVPGQFSEWLHGESLTNQGMMLSPWFPPRYLWAAIEGAAGLDLSGPEPSVNPRPAPEWQWLGVRNLPLGGRAVAWFVVRTPELRLYTTGSLGQSLPCETYDVEVSDQVEVGDEAATTLALQRDGQLVILVGNTASRTITTVLRFRGRLEGAYASRSFSSLRSAWLEWDAFDPAELSR
ncbi:MAG: MGH1-like glycoside hydrolase domain-containing protein, partial [Candidatus Limnocylindrales bacterium]